MQKGSLYKNAAGFSLVEMMIVISIIIIVAASLVPLMVFVNQSSHNSQSRMTAYNLASDIMEEIRAMDYEEIGTAGGNPSGTIPQLQTVSFNGADFDVETLISWGSAKGNNDEINPVAYKNARVIVRGLDTFTGQTGKLAELHTVITRDGEEPLIKDGHLRARVLDSAEQPIDEPSVNIQIPGQQLMTDYNGTALFGILDSGYYDVRARVEDGLFPSPKETVVNGWIEKNNIEVEDYGLSDVIFSMEKKSNACHLEIKLVDEITGNAILESGKATLAVRLDGATYTVYNDREFLPGSFKNDCLPAEFSGVLWPKGTYNIIISGVPAYQDYNLSVDNNAFITGTGERWTGEFPDGGTTLSVTIPMKIYYFYEEKTKEDYENNTDMEDLTATDENTLELAYFSDAYDNESIVNPISSSSKKSKGPDKLFDGDKRQSSSWDSNVSPNSQPQWIGCEFTDSIPLTGVLVYLSHNESNPGSNPNFKPKDFYIRVSNDGLNWQTVCTGTFPVDVYNYFIDINPSVTCKFFELWITSEYRSPGQGVRIYEIEIFTDSGRNEDGSRLSKPIPLSEHNPEKGLSIEWSVTLPEGTTFEVWTVVTDGEIPVPTDGFKRVNNGDPVPDIGYLENFENKYLWILEVFTTEDITKSPVLHWLRIKEEGLME